LRPSSVELTPDNTPLAAQIDAFYIVCIIENPCVLICSKGIVDQWAPGND
jgi:hypothetical protein